MRADNTEERLFINFTLKFSLALDKMRYFNYRKKKTADLCRILTTIFHFKLITFYIHIKFHVLIQSECTNDLSNLHNLFQDKKQMEKRKSKFWHYIPICLTIPYPLACILSNCFDH